LKIRVYFQFLTVSWNDRWIQKQREDATEKLIVDLYPLDTEADRLTVCRICVAEPNPAEGCVDKLRHIPIDDGDAYPLEG
jgi:hypothetical protein